MDFMIDNDIAKYRAKKPSSTSKYSSKAKHKHTYEPCILRYYFNYDCPGKPKRVKEIKDHGTYCTICGKIGDWISFLDSKKIEQFNKDYPDAPVFNVEGYRDKFVNIVDK